MDCRSVIFLFLAIAFITAVRGQPTVQFTDVTEQVGVDPRPDRLKHGGPLVADLDGDGIYDLIFSYHFQARIDVYFGQPNGTFVRDSFTEFGDIHGITVGLRTTSAQTRVLSINKGGAFGRRPRPPTVYLVDKDRNFVNITESFGLGAVTHRGRVTVFMDLSLRSASTRRRMQSGPDLLVVGFIGNNEDGLQHAYENNGGLFSLRDIGGFAGFREGRVAVADIDGDRNLEVFNYPRLRAFKLVAPFTLEESTESILNATNGNITNYMSRTVSAMTEFDLDNKGRFDLYLARGLFRTLNPSLPDGDVFGSPDVLLRQTRRGLIDISASAGIPSDTETTSVVSGDYDNDGYVDLFLPTVNGPDLFLMNNGDRTFTRINSPISKEDGTAGGHAVAVDYDQDGRLDLMVGQGSGESLEGPNRIMRNTLPSATIGNYLLVRVGIEPRRRATSLHAVVQVRVGRMRMMRRVAGTGSQNGGPSYLDTLHFGLGSFDEVDSVRVRWVGGSRVMRSGVAANQKITFGIVD